MKPSSATRSWAERRLAFRCSSRRGLHRVALHSASRRGSLRFGRKWAAKKTLTSHARPLVSIHPLRSGTPSASIPPSKPQPPDDAPDPDVVGDERLPLPICPGRLDLGRALWRPGFDADDRVPTGSTAESGGVEPEFGMDAAEAGADGCGEGRPGPGGVRSCCGRFGSHAEGRCGGSGQRARDVRR